MPFPVFAVAPLSAAWIAPGPNELAEATEELEARIVALSAIGDALFRVQSAWAESNFEQSNPCSDALLGSYAARSHILGSAYRDAVQSGRVQLIRLERLWAAETIQPLLSKDDADKATKFRKTLAWHEHAYAEASAWQVRFIEPHVQCPLELVPTEGLAWTGTVAKGTSHAVAIIGTGTGQLCPIDQPAVGVVVTPFGEACWSATSCNCTPVEVAPGAVLGPE